MRAGQRASVGALCTDCLGGQCRAAGATDQPHPSTSCSPRDMPAASPAGPGPASNGQDDYFTAVSKEMANKLRHDPPDGACGLRKRSAAWPSAAAQLPACAAAHSRAVPPPAPPCAHTPPPAPCCTPGMDSCGFVPVKRLVGTMRTRPSEDDILHIAKIDDKVGVND